MLACHRILCILLTFNLLINLSKQDLAVPVYTPDNESSANNQQLDQLDKAKSGNNDNLHAAGIVVPVSVLDPTSNNQTTSAQKSNQNKSRKRKHQSNKQYRPNESSKSNLDNLAYNLNLQANNPLNDLNKAILIQLTKQQQKTTNQQDPVNSNTDLPFQFVPVFTTEPSANNLLNSDTNQLAFQLYLRKLAQLALQQRQKDLEFRSELQEKPKITKRVFNSNSLSSNQQNLNNLQSSASSLQLANLNQFLNQQQQPVYTLIQPQQQASSQPLYLALQPSFPVQSTTKNQQQPNTQINSLIETGDKIIAKIKQWSTDVFNSKNGLNRQINEVLSLAGDVAIVTLIGVPLVSAITFGVSSLMAPLSQLNRKLDRKSTANKQQKTKSEEAKKDKNDEKAAKSDQGSAHQSQKSTKSLDKKSRIVSIIERAGDEVNHLKNLYEIAKNFDTAFKKYNVQERECRYRVLCEVGLASQSLNDKTTSNIDNQFLVNNNLLREGSRRKKRQIREASELGRLVSTTTANSEQQLNKTIECEKQSNCSKLNLNTTNSANKVQSNIPTPANFLLNQFKLIEHSFLNNNRASLKNLLHNFNLDRFMNDNKDGLINFMMTVDYLMNKAKKSNFFTYLLNDDHFNQAFRSENKLFKTIAERSKQLQDKLKDFLDNLTAFQHVVSKESQSLDFNKSKYDYRILPYYNLRSKRTTSLNSLSGDKNQTNEPANEFSEEKVDVSGLKFILNDLINQLRSEQQQDNPILPLTKIWLNPYLNAIEYGAKYGQERCKVKYLKCTQNYLGLNNGAFEHTQDLEIISNNHVKDPNSSPKKREHNSANLDKKKNL